MSHWKKKSKDVIVESGMCFPLLVWRSGVCCICSTLKSRGQVRHKALEAQPVGFVVVLVSF